MSEPQKSGIWQQFKAVRPVYLLVVFLVFGAIAIFALRHNYETMTKLRQQVYQADQNNGNVEAALQNLRLYVTHHMNTSLASGPNAVYPPIQLKYTYDRLVQARSAQVQSENASIYTDAQHYCEAQIPTGFSGRYRVGCIQDYINSHGAKQQPVPDSLYKFDFVAAKWSPDLAGWSQAATALSGVLLIVLWLARRLDRLSQRRG